MSDKLMQVLVFGFSMVGYVALAIAEKATAEYVTLVGPVMAVVILQQRLGGKVDEIYENTNGKLEKRIEDAVGRVLTKIDESRGLPPAE